jgi:hypothetical protein
VPASPTARHAASLVSLGLVVAAVAIVAVAVAARGAPTAEAAPDEPPPLASAPWQDEPPPTPEPPPPPPPEPVRGTVGEVEIVDLSVTGTKLFQPGSGADAPVPVDQAAVDELVARVAAGFDAHLTALEGVEEPDADDPAVVPLGGLDPTPLTGTLAGPETPVEEATYHLRVGVRGVPEWLELTVVVGSDEAPRSASFVVVPGDPPRLLAGEVLP